MSEFDEYVYESPSYTPAAPRLGIARVHRASDPRPLPPSAAAKASALSAARNETAGGLNPTGVSSRKRRRIDEDALL
jgi:hypothetical protein